MSDFDKLLSMDILIKGSYFNLEDVAEDQRSSGWDCRLLVWRCKGKDVWDASASLNSYLKSRDTLNANGYQVEEMIQLDRDILSRNSFVQSGIPQPESWMTKFGWMWDAQDNGWYHPLRRTGFRDDGKPLDASDYPVLRTDDEYWFADDELAPPGLYVWSHCGFELCCRPSGPFASILEAKMCLWARGPAEMEHEGVAQGNTGLARIYCTVKRNKY